MRIALATIVVLCLAGFTEGQEPPTKETNEETRARLALEMVRKEAEEYRITLEGSGTPLKMEPDPILKTASPVLGQLHGSIFLWTDKGRPEVVAHIYKWYSPHKLLGVAFHSLGTQPLTANRAGKVVWAPVRGGVEMKPVPDAPAPSDSAAGRLRQLRALAEEFTATHTYPPKYITRELRLMPKPLYRYASPERGVIDGAMFAFTIGTDPEVFMILEARADKQGRPQWQCGFTRDTFTAARVTHKGNEIWSVQELPLEPRSKFYDPREPYMELPFQPGEGHNPLEPTEAPARRSGSLLEPLISDSLRRWIA